MLHNTVVLVLDSHTKELAKSHPLMYLIFEVMYCIHPSSGLFLTRLGDIPFHHKKHILGLDTQVMEVALFVLPSPPSV
jgi:hypothetical protein